MSQQTGEDELGLHRILGLLRAAGVSLLLLHCFYCTYPSVKEYGLSGDVGDEVMGMLGRTGLFASSEDSKLIVLGLLAVSLLGAKGRKTPDLRPASGLWLIGAGLALYFGSVLLLADVLGYGVLCISGYLLILRGGIYLSRVMWRRPPEDVFNRFHESFPQEERLLQGEGYIHLPARYQYKHEVRDSWINFYCFRGTIVLGSPGSGKTWYVIENMIRQHIHNGYSMLLYDFKYDDLSRLAYNCFLSYRSNYPGKPAFYNIQLDDLNRSHRCNPLSPAILTDISHADAAARTLLLGLNMEWIRKQGDFFVESPINFVTSLIWFLRRYEDGKYCSWPHVIELSQVPSKQLFTLLRTAPEIQALVAGFLPALLDGVMETLDGQIASATIAMARLSSPAIYYVLTGDDFTLDLNNPDEPKILTLGGSPQKIETYGPIISVYINAVNRLANRKNMHHFSEILEEFSTIVVHTMDKTIATGRSNKMAVTLCCQDANQLRLAYGKEFADVILHTCGNVISGAVSGETARLLAERFGKTMQDRESLTITSADLHTTQSQQLEYSIPMSRIASLSAGEFVGMVADTPEQPVDLKGFCCRVINDPEALAREEAAFVELPVVRQVTQEMLMEHFMQVRQEIGELVEKEMERIDRTPELRHLVIE
jgi:YWFCY protein/Type IV secretory system Conjugative DNA transfer